MRFASIRQEPMAAWRASPTRTLIKEWDSHVIVSPNPWITEPIVATAWNRLKRFESVDRGLTECIDTNRKRGPESVPCDIEQV